MKKVLIAEDDTFLANAYRVKMAKVGFEVQMAADGEEVLSILQKFLPDVILLDLIMPKKDGFQTLEEIKKNDAWKNIPVIIASNLGQKEDIDRGMALGANDFIVKSDIPLSGIIDKINKLLGITPMTT